MKRTPILAVLVAPLLLVAASPNARADEKVWAQSSGTRVADCAYCHGDKGEGGLGPDLAGRKLTLAQFTRAVRKPWGIMPAYPNLSDEAIQGVWEYLTSLPPVAEAAAPRIPDPGPSGPKGQREAIVFGCAQCHGPEITRPRTALGGQAADATFDMFKDIVYNHPKLYPRNWMGMYSADRLTEPTLKLIYDFITAIGLRVPVTAALVPDAPAGGNAGYTLTLTNGGKAGKGLTAEEITVSLVIPEGAKVVSATGPGYVGVSRSAEGNAEVAVWKVPKLAPTEKQEFKLTLSGASAAAATFNKSMVSWLKPDLKSFPNQAKDPVAERTIPVPKGDAIFVTVRRPAAR